MLSLIAFCRACSGVAIAGHEHSIGLLIDVIYLQLMESIKILGAIVVIVVYGINQVQTSKAGSKDISLCWPEDHIMAEHSKIWLTISSTGSVTSTISPFVSSSSASNWLLSISDFI